MSVRFTLILTASYHRSLTGFFYLIRNVHGFDVHDSEMDTVLKKNLWKKNQTAPNSKIFYIYDLYILVILLLDLLRERSQNTHAIFQDF